jgi:hypothetical protein
MAKTPHMLPPTSYSAVEESRYRNEMSQYLQYLSSKVSSIENGSVSTPTSTMRRSNLIMVPIGQVRIG